MYELSTFGHISLLQRAKLIQWPNTGALAQLGYEDVTSNWISSDAALPKRAHSEDLQSGDDRQDLHKSSNTLSWKNWYIVHQNGCLQWISMNHHSQNSTILIIQSVVMNTRRWAKRNGACSANVKHRDGRQNIIYFYLRLTLSKGARRKTRVPRIVIFLIPIGNLPSRILMLKSRSKDACATSLESEKENTAFGHSRVKGLFYCLP